MAQCLVTIDMITREAVQLFKNSDAFLAGLEEECAADEAFAAGEQWPAKLPPVSLPVAVAMGVVAAVVKNPVVTRRFWEWWK